MSLKERLLQLWVPLHSDLLHGPERSPSGGGWVGGGCSLRVTRNNTLV